MSNETTEQIVISGVPKKLLSDIDMMAKKEKRKRSAFVRILLEEIVERRRSEIKQAA